MDEETKTPEGCTHDCSSCGESCSSRTTPESLLEKPNAGSNVKNMIGIVSGKGGVGKSLVTSMLSVLTQRLGYSAAVMDADITGPSIPQIFGVHSAKIIGDESGMAPVESQSGIKLMSVNLLLEDETTPVVWRGPIIAGTVKQFWTDVRWGDVDYMFVDMPPGTGDVPLTVFQTLPVDGIVVVASPQELVSLIVAKAVNMANMMNIPVLGLVENMSYVLCPDCGKKIDVFGESHVAETAAEFGVPVLARIPIDPQLARQADLGVIESFEGDMLDGAADAIEKLL